MDWLIIAKWTTDFTGREYKAPSIISTMIDMALNLGAISHGMSPLIGSAVTQQTISILFLILAFICTPWMLVPKPYFLWQDIKAHMHKAEHDDHHNEHAVHMEDRPMHAINQGDSEKLLA
jgi:V-type H+-transporting ATPase subunit a